MAGIDNNTLLYLRGDSFNDLSLMPNTITNNGSTISDIGKLNKSYSINNSNFKSSNFTANGDFTIEGYVYLDSSISSNVTRCFLNGSNGETVTQGNFLIWFVYSNNKHTIEAHFGDGVGWYANIKHTTNSLFDNWFHIALTRSGNSFTLFFDGKNVGTTTYNMSQFTNLIFGDIFNATERRFLNGKLENIRLSNVIRYTEDFTPPTKPYSSITIDTLSQTATNINFSVTKLGQETINKVEVFVNGKLSQTYTEGYDDINYVIDSSICSFGNNNITIKVTYDDNYTEEKVLTHIVDLPSLPPISTETSLLDTLNSIKEVTKLTELEKNTLKKVLDSKGVDVTDINKMSILISKVNLLENPEMNKLYLYKYGDEYVSNTGGWTFRDTWEAGGVSKEGIKNSDNLQVNVTYDCAGFIADTIDFTNYSKLKVDYEITKNTDTSKLRVIVKDAYPYNSNNLAIGTTSDIKRDILEINVSSVTGVHKLSCESYTGTSTTGQLSFKIYQIWLEK